MSMCHSDLGFEEIDIISIMAITLFLILENTQAVGVMM